MVSTGILPALGALLLFGGWAVAGGFATRSATVVNAVFLSYAAGIVIAGGYVFVARLSSAFSTSIRR